jgi:hypothetical protein
MDVCMYIYGCMDVYMYGCIYMDVCMYGCMYVYIWMYGCIYVWMYVCMDVCMYGCMYVYIWMYGCIYVWMYVCIYMYVWMYICMDVCMYIYVCMCIKPTIGLLDLASCKVRAIGFNNVRILKPPHMAGADWYCLGGLGAWWGKKNMPCSPGTMENGDELYPPLRHVFTASRPPYSRADMLNTGSIETLPESGLPCNAMQAP